VGVGATIIEGNVVGKEGDAFSAAPDDVICCWPKVANRDRRLAAAPERTPAMARPIARGGGAVPV